ncbi:IclR family transcriptional regulator [uncultured Ruegeria sp.]|uniref:IclR family transcriptional regulator n=1 Tax=uncultured Ruegeria sp. TaxID=259304 RepID=UPI00261269AC|nr:IclR family transcriptional regulator [uncultured Ruegeria sp.]
MSSATKTLELLNHFTTDRPEIGLSQLCRLAGRDKATTYRHLQALEMAGFVEQNPLSKQYRLGPVVLHLAHVREATVPRKASARAALVALSDATGETAHVTVLSGKTLYALDDCESPRHGIRAVVDINVFPLHATASGICALAFGPDELFDFAVTKLEKFTDTTPSTADELSELISSARETGLGRGNQSFEVEILGLAAPVFDHTGLLAGAVSVASVASRFTSELEQVTKSELIVAAREISRNWGGTLPSHIEAAWANSLKQPHSMETTS